MLLTRPEIFRNFNQIKSDFDDFENLPKLSWKNTTSHAFLVRPCIRRNFPNFLFSRTFQNLRKNDIKLEVRKSQKNSFRLENRLESSVKSLECRALISRRVHFSSFSSWRLSLFADFASQILIQCDWRWLVILKNILLFYPRSFSLSFQGLNRNIFLNLKVKASIIICCSLQQVVTNSYT